MSDIKTVINRFKELGVSRLFLKELPENDNSKNQIYLATGNLEKVFDSISIIPHKDFVAKQGPSHLNYHADLDLKWMHSGENLIHAPNSKLIFYSKYPEARISGFLRNAPGAPKS